MTASGCERAAVPAKLSHTQALEAAVQGAAEILSIEQTFKDSHPYRGKTGDEFLIGLQREGFTCRVQWRNYVKALGGDRTGSFNSEQRPAIECDRIPARIPGCLVFRVAIEPDPDFRYPTLASFLDAFKAREVNRVWFLCETQPRASDVVPAIQAGFKDGTVLAIQ
jgi:hypothetical protein